MYAPMTIEQLYEIYLQHPVVTTDSRNCPEGSIFFALKGDNFNGNRFAAAALEQGCAYAVVDEESEELGVRSEELGVGNGQSTYDLNGRKVTTPEKGKIYIINGKKVKK